MKRNGIATALFVTLATPAAAYLPINTDAEMAANNHGYHTAALETLCDVLVVSDPALRAKLDRKYRENEKYRKFFLDGYAAVANDAEDILAKGNDQKRHTRCYLAGSNATWLKFNRAGMDQLELKAAPNPTIIPLADKVRIYAPINAIASPCELEAINQADNSAMLEGVKSDQDALKLLRRLTFGNAGGLPRRP